MFPNSFVLSKKFKRDIKLNERHIGNKLPLDDLDRSQYDYHTLFYNLFLDYQNENIVIIGPPLLNFKKLFFPLKISFNDTILSSYKIIETAGCFIMCFKLKKSCREKNYIKVYTCIKSIYKSFIIRKNHYKCGNRILTTIQKNNRSVWIEDWISYYRSKYNIDNVIIYDNGSENQGNLIEKFTNRNISIIPYNFIYGPPKSIENSFLQTALLNNTLYQFTKSGSYVFNFDIDELLVVNPLSLDQSLQGNVYYLVRQWQVPFITDKEQYTYSDFIWKDKNPKDKENNPKYIISKNKTISLKIHSCNTKNSVMYLNDYFLHYKAITDGWKTYHHRLQRIIMEHSEEYLPIDNV